MSEDDIHEHQFTEEQTEIIRAIMQWSVDNAPKDVPFANVMSVASAVALGATKAIFEMVKVGYVKIGRG